MGKKIEFTPVDNAATSIMKIIKYSKSNNIIFHIFNHNYLYVKDFLKILSDIGVNVNLISSEKFKELLLLLIIDPRNYIFNTLANDLDKDSNLNYDKINTQSIQTVNFLKHCGFEWKKIDKNYVLNILKLIKGF